MKQMTRQLIISAIVLASVTALSFGIRQFRISIHRARNVASAPAVGDQVSTLITDSSGQGSTLR